MINEDEGKLNKTNAHKLTVYTLMAFLYLGNCIKMFKSSY